MTASPFQRGDRIAVPYGTRTHDATVLDVRDGRVSVLIDDNADAPIETFYRVDELIPRAVVFRFCRSIPEWQFYCAPTDVIRSGRAHTLAEAQAKYRSALPFSPGSNPLPNLVKEYIERETSPGSNVWVRTPLGAPNGKDIARAIARNYESMPRDYRQFVRDTRTSRGDTVVIPVNPRSSTNGARTNHAVRLGSPGHQGTRSSRRAHVATGRRRLRRHPELHRSARGHVRPRHHRRIPNQPRLRGRAHQKPIGASASRSPRLCLVAVPSRSISRPMWGLVLAVGEWGG